MANDRTTIAEHWHLFAKNHGLFHPDITEAHREEMKQMFFAGVATVIGILRTVSAGDKYSDAEGVVILQGIEDELQEFIDKNSEEV
jgi:hypothetical protein